MDTNYARRINIDPKIMAGKPVIRGTRIPVDLIVRMTAQGLLEQDILAEYPNLTLEDIHAALSYAADVVAGETFLPLLVTA